METLTKNQSIFILGITGISLAVSSIAGNAIVKQNEKLVKKHNDMRDVGLQLCRIAAYQQELLNKHTVMLEEFDRMVFEDMTGDLRKCLKHLGYDKSTEGE